ncbi:MAG: TonB-dependent siderophore receptor [Aquabacterium sp.]|uniref:TonB-dependent receptor n=1 Tax=Aquabacterium sp. TaxID=1872578 RepID=UPI001B6DD6FE|nr:TonB-dependent siderophore receptor [Aquabacterium sp.]MBP7131796.1 TonB-dependent siderophore receptor [Aquabacterium sp.]
MSRPVSSSALPPARPHPAVLPLSAIAAGVGLSLLSTTVLAQTATPDTPSTSAQVATAIDPSVQTLPSVSIKAQTDRKPEAKTSYQAVSTSIGKGKQALRDIPQSITVVTEKLMDDRGLDDLKDLLRTTAGVTFQAGETGEEDVRLRGFSLSQAGDLYIDGMRDPSLYERDTFNNDRVEVLKGSASMLFGRGSTGGVVNQVSKQPFLMTQHEVEASLGLGSDVRLTGDFNVKTGDAAALRMNIMTHEVDDHGVIVSKKGFAPTYRWGIGTRDEFSVGFYHLEYDNNPIYNHPWFAVDGKIIPKLDADSFYGLDSDYNRGNATYGTLSHLHRFGDGGELKTTLRHGRYQRELWASVARFATGTTLANLNDNTVINRASKGRIAITDGTVLQSDYNNKFQLAGMRHNVITGLDWSQDEARRANSYADPAGVTRPTTTVGNPDAGQSITDSRAPVAFNEFTSRNLGLYVQDMVELSPTIKVLAGLRHDRFRASYDTVAGDHFDRSDNLVSQRLGALFQPSDWTSFHASYGTSFNTSGDTYQFAVRGPSLKDANTPAEKSRNFELGTKLDLFNQRLSINASAFYTEKYNERNTDPDTAATQQLLSGKRHAKGVDIDLAGQITPKWEAYLSYTWIPVARIDESNVTTGNAQQQGDRPGLTPKHSVSLWTTYQVAPKWRVGGGLNHRGEQNPEGNRTLMAAAFTTLDLMAEYKIGPSTSVKLNVTNVTDELYADSLYRGFYAPGAARSVQVSLKSSF